MTLFPKFPKIQRPKALKIDVFDYDTPPLSFDAQSPGNPAIIHIKFILPETTVILAADGLGLSSL